MSKGLVFFYEANGVFAVQSLTIPRGSGGIQTALHDLTLSGNACVLCKQPIHHGIFNVVYTDIHGAPYMRTPCVGLACSSCDTRAVERVIRECSMLAARQVDAAVVKARCTWCCAEVCREPAECAKNK